MGNIRWIMKKAREFQTNIYFCSIDYAKAFDCVDHNKLWKILQEIGIPVELFQILKDATVKVLHSICQQIWKTQQWPQDWKRFVVFIPIPKKGKPKNAQTTTQLHSSHTLVK